MADEQYGDHPGKARVIGAGPTATGPGAVAIGRLYVTRGDVVFGDKIVHKPGKPRKVLWPLRVGQVPDIADRFQDRPGIDLAGRFDDAEDDGSVTLVAAGLGGTGKTQLAAQYFGSVRDWVDLRVWVNATTRSTVVTGYAAAAVATGTAAGVDGDEQVAAASFLSWLERTDKSWLIVLDDVTDPADLDRLWPTGQSGQVIVTTRRRDADLGGRGRVVVDVDVFEPDEAQAYLTGKLPAWQCDDVPGVATDLGFLPLALAQAASYMRHRAGGGLRCSEYRTRLADQAAKLDLLLPGDARADGYRREDTARATVATTWTLSMVAANQLPPPGAARAVLTLASMLDPNGIPLEFFTTPTALGACRDLVGRQSPSRIPWWRGRRRNQPDHGTLQRLSVRDILDACDHLARFSLITLSRDDAGQRTIRTHALVQRAVHDSLSAGALDDLAVPVADGLLQLWPEADHRSAVAQQVMTLRGNVAALRAVAGDALFVPRAHDVLFRAASSLADQPHQAVEQCLLLASDCERLLGAEHPDTLTSHGNLAYTYQAAGRLAEAIPLFERTLGDTERLMGVEHPGALTIRNNLASAYQDVGRLDDAIPLFERTLADRERPLGADTSETLTIRNNLAGAFLIVGRLDDAILLFERTLALSVRLLGAQHPDTLTCRGNLASAFLGLGRSNEAIPLFERTLADRERLLGAEHPETLGSRNNLAYGYQAVGRLDEAIPLFERTLVDRERLLGPEHPDTLKSRNNLAFGYQAVGRLAEVIPLFERTLVDCERLLGPEHPDTLSSRNDLTSAYRAAGRLGEAIPLLERTLVDRERLLGPEHPHTLGSRNNLAYGYQAAGRLAEAIPLFERTLVDRERLGAETPEILASRNNLASAYRAAGRLGEAIPLFERTLADRERLLGPEHPDTLNSRNNLANAFLSVGRLGEAIPLFERTLADRERLLGAENPEILASRNNLASAYQAAGRLAEAIPLFERTLSDMERWLGPEHPNTLTSRNNLAGAYWAAGRMDQAIPLFERTLADRERLLGAEHPDTLGSRNNLAGAHRTQANRTVKGG